MTGEQPVGLTRAILDRKGAGNPERVEAVQIPPGGQYFGRAQQISARGGTEIAAVQRVQDRGDFAVRGQQAVQPQPFGNFGNVGCVEHLATLGLVRRLTDDVQAMRNERVFQFEQCCDKAVDMLRGVRVPGRFSGREFHGGRLCLDQRS